MEAAGRKTLSLGDTEIAIGETSVQAVHADFLTEHRSLNGTVALSFGCLRTDGNCAPTIDVVSRIRVNIVTAQVVRDILTDIIDKALKPADTSKAN